MIRAKAKTSFYDQGLDMYFRDQDHKIEYLRYRNMVEAQEQMKRKRAEIHKKISVLDHEISLVNLEKKEWQQEMDDYADVNTNDLRVMIDDYDTQIMKLEEAKRMVQMSMRTSKRELKNEFKGRKPFTKLQPLLNKKDRLLNQLKYL